MNVLYICRVSEYQASGKQIDIPRNIGIEFFNVPKSYIDEKKNIEVNICHINNLQSFESVEIQSATNLRWSSKLITFLACNGDDLSEGDLLVKITGVGRMAIASVAPEGVIGNTNQHMVVVKTGNKEISKYLARYLNLDIIEKRAVKWIL